ncbi:MAG: hypothetical protein R3B48_10455 [Kofleriaceae bacterium]
MLAIISKAVFEKAAGKAPALGARLGLDRYTSGNRGLAPLAEGGRLFLVTVRPPDEALWLVAVLEAPTFDGAAWVAAPCDTPMTDISSLKGALVFANGKGLPTTPGALGMSLQTPRVLTDGDVAHLLSALGAPGAAAPPRAAPAQDASQPLRDAVLAAPLDDAPKRALGAHWRTAGEPRGELVELDLALRGPLSIPRRRALRARHAELCAAHQARWWPWPLDARRQRGGFLVAVRAEAPGFFAIAPELFAKEPVSELELHGLDEESAAELSRAPWLSRLATLIIRGPIGDEGLAALLRSRHLDGLTALNLSANELSGEELALGKALPSLRRLVLTNNPLGDDGAKALARWTHLDQLRTLYLTACELSADGLGALLRSGKLRRLEKLTLSNNELGDAGATALADHVEELPALRYLELRDTELGRAGVAALRRTRLAALPPQR